MDVGKLTREKRIELGENQNKFGKRFGISHAAVSDIERGITKHIPSKLIELLLNNIIARIGYYGKNEHTVKNYKTNLDLWLKGKQLEFDPIKYADFGKMALAVVEFDKDHCIYILLEEDCFKLYPELPAIPNK